MTAHFIMTNRLFTLNHPAKIINNSADPKCWFCKKFKETVDHLVSGCPIMTPNGHMIRWDDIFTRKCHTIMHHMLRTDMNISHIKLHSWNPPPLIKGGGGGGRTFPKFSHLRGGGSMKFFARKGG